MTRATEPLTKNESRIRNDNRATSRYAKRRHIDRWHENRQLQRATREVWE